MSLPPSVTSHSSADADAVAAACAAHGINLDQFAQLRTRVEAAKATAYCPYSEFRVGATLLCGGGSSTTTETTTTAEDDAYVSGANVENAAYPVGTCAERVAIGTAVVAGHRRFRAIAVSTDISPPASPCGMCRQFIREFCDLSTPIFMFDKNNDFVVMKLEALLPLSFGPEHLHPKKK